MIYTDGDRELPTSLDEDEKSVEGVVAAFADAISKHDARAFSMVFHQDADFTNVWGMHSRGRQAIEEFHKPLFEGDGLKVPSFKTAVFKVLDTRIRMVRPDVATVDVTWSQTGAILNGEDWGPRKGLVMWVVTKERGVWAVSVMHNMDLPLEPPESW
jgi:uncharacterized protein (TIGR02246 family)